MSTLCAWVARALNAIASMASFGALMLRGEDQEEALTAGSLEADAVSAAAWAAAPGGHAVLDNRGRLLLGGRWVEAPAARAAVRYVLDTRESCVFYINLDGRPCRGVAYPWAHGVAVQALPPLPMFESVDLDERVLVVQGLAREAERLYAEHLEHGGAHAEAETHPAPIRA